MNSKLLSVGEPMGIFIAQNGDSLECAKAYEFAVTGAEFNVAVGLSRLGRSVGYMSKIGGDPFGRQIINAMKDNHIDTSLVSCIDGQYTGFMLKSKTSEEEALFYYNKNSAASTITPEDIGSIHLEEYQYLYLTGVFPAISPNALDAAKSLLRKAKACGLTIFFDAGLDSHLWRDTSMMIYHINEMAFLSDYFLLNVKEGSILTGGLTTPESIASYYQVRGILNVVVKAGERGVYVATKKGHEYVPVFEIDNMVDPAGMDHGFAVGIISGVMDGLPLREAADRGNAISSMQAMATGDNVALPDRVQLTAFMEKHKRKQTE